MNGTLLILLVIVLSGFIAYIGDRIGMKAGKKRISIFGLRPRYSSKIITIVTGIVIAALSIGILLLTYGGLRQALFNINQVLTQLDQLNQELELKDGELNYMQQEINERMIELKDLQKNKKELENELDETTEELEKVENSLTTAQSEIEDLEVERSELNLVNDDLKAERKDLEDTIENLNTDIKNLEQEYALLEEHAYRLGNLYSAYRAEDLVYQKGDIIYSDILIGGQSETQTIQELDNFLNEADEVAARRPIRIEPETGMALRLREEDIFNVAREIYNMQEGKRVIVRLMARVNVSSGDWLLADFMNLLEDWIVFSKEEEIISQTIDASQSPENIEKSLQELLGSINEKAIDKGILYDQEGEIGSINFARYYEIINKIDEKNEKVAITVSIKEDIWRQDNLDENNLQFEIIKAGS